MDLETFFTFIIVFLGSVTVALSIFCATAFQNYAKGTNRIGRRLAGGIKWQLAGEAIIGAGTLAFALMAHFNLLGSSISTVEQSLIRLIMFAATSLTTVHLWWIVITMRK